MSKIELVPIGEVVTLNGKDFIDWAITKNTPKIVCYHVGSFVQECLVAGFAYEMYTRGKLYLMQRRIEPSKFEYLAVKRPVKDKTIKV